MVWVQLTQRRLHRASKDEPYQNYGPGLVEVAVEVAQQWGILPEGRIEVPLTTIRGVGMQIQADLHSLGITTLSALVKADADWIAERLSGSTARQVLKWQEHARHLAGSNDDTEEIMTDVES